MIVLGIETSCDETAAAVVAEGTDVRASVVSSQVDLHARYGGVVPEIAGRAHVMDRPADGEGRSYVIERDVHLDGRAALDALIVDYTEQAKQADAVPMASSVLARELQAAA